MPLKTDFDAVLGSRPPANGCQPRNKRAGRLSLSAYPTSGPPPLYLVSPPGVGHHKAIVWVRVFESASLEKIFVVFRSQS